MFQINIQIQSTLIKNEDMTYISSFMHLQFILVFSTDVECDIIQNIMDVVLNVVAIAVLF